MKTQFALMLVMLTAGVSSAFANDGGGNIGSSNSTQIECNLYDVRPGADQAKNGDKTVTVSSTQRSRVALAPGVFLNNMPASTIDDTPLPSGSGRLMIEVYEEVGGKQVGPMLFEGSQEFVSVSLLTSTNKNQRIGVSCHVTK